MTTSGTVEAIRAEAGNEQYAYSLSMDDPETVLLIDRWRDQTALDAHHASPMMQTILKLREKYGLTVRAERFFADEKGFPEKDAAYLNGQTK